MIEQPTDKPLMFYKAVYPYSSDLRNEFSFAVGSDQSNSSSYTMSDLMTADTEATTEVTPHLVFSHKLSNIIINLKYEEKPGGSEQMFFNYCCPLKVSEQRDIHPQCCCNGIADDFPEGKPLS